jgi:hypothetical protein
LLQQLVLQAYNEAVNCGSGGGPYDPFLSLTQVVITTDPLNGLIGTAAALATQQFNLYATWTGQCRGCQATPFNVLQIDVPVSDQGRKLLKQQRQSVLQQENETATPTVVVDTTHLHQQQRSLQQTSTRTAACNCSVPLESAFLAYFNNHFVPFFLSFAIDSLVSVTQLEQVSCSPTINTFDTYLSLQFGAGPGFTNAAALITQLPFVSQITTLAYNDANTNSLTNCDLNFVTVSDTVQMILPLGSNINNRRHLATVTASVASITAVVKVPVVCRGCSVSVSLLNDVSGRRRRRARKARRLHQQPNNSVVINDYDHEIYDMNDIHRKLPIINGNCYCPVSTNTTTPSGRTSTQHYLQVLNDFLQILGPQGAGLITVVSSALDAVQVEPVNCTNNVTDLNMTVTLALNGSSTSINDGGADFLQQAFLNTYNDLAQHYCDPYHRRVDLAKLLQDQPPTGVNMTMAVTGSCRGCPSSTPLFNDVSGRRHLGREQEQKEEGSMSTSSGLPVSWEKKENLNQRQLQSGGLCFCPVNPIAARAPDTLEFLAAFNDAIYPYYYLFVLIEPRTTAPPSKSPTSPPTTQIPTPFPTASPSASPTHKPTSPPTPLPTASPTVSPTHKPTSLPTTPPTGSPTVSPTHKPTSLPTTPPTPSPTASPTAAPTRKPTPPPTSSPTPLLTTPPTAAPTSNPTSSPTTPPTASPSAPPTTKPTRSPTPSPTAPPTPLPTLPPTTPPTMIPTARRTHTPTKSPTAKPTCPPTVGPTHKPSAPPTKRPTHPPTKKPIHYSPTW